MEALEVFRSTPMGRKECLQGFGTSGSQDSLPHLFRTQAERRLEDKIPDLEEEEEAHLAAEEEEATHLVVASRLEEDLQATRLLAEAHRTRRPEGEAAEEVVLVHLTRPPEGVAEVVAVVVVHHGPLLEEAGHRREEGVVPRGRRPGEVEDLEEEADLFRLRHPGQAAVAWYPPETLSLLRDRQRDLGVLAA
jgi:hypothetical protein